MRRVISNLEFLEVASKELTTGSNFVLHELWAGMLLALAFGLHRPGRKYGAALVAAGLALAIREHALPFVRGEGFEDRPDLVRSAVFPR